MMEPASGDCLSELQAFALELAAEACRLIQSSAGRGLETTSLKDGLEIVTDTDLLVSEAAVKAIERVYPRHGVISEEIAGDRNARTTFDEYWIIDPLDGTANFARNHDMCAVSIAYVRQGRTMVSVVAAPFRDECFSAIRGRGARLNNTPIEVSRVRSLSSSVIGTGFPRRRPKPELDRLVTTVGHVLESAYDLRRSGCPTLDLCFVANGRIDAFFERLAPWDFAAGLLIAAEAGAATSLDFARDATLAFDRKPRTVIAATPRIYSELAGLLDGSNHR
jgi:myo-inositol-1(or 4)-monophosphatase